MLISNIFLGQPQKLINVQDLIRPYRGHFFQKINCRACTAIRYSRVIVKSMTVQVRVNLWIFFDVIDAPIFGNLIIKRGKNFCQNRPYPNNPESQKCQFFYTENLTQTQKSQVLTFAKPDPKSYYLKVPET